MSSDHVRTDPARRSDQGDSDEGWRDKLPPSFEARFSDLLEVILPLYSRFAERFEPARFLAWLPLLASTQRLVATVGLTVKQWRVLARQNNWDAISESLDELRDELVVQAQGWLDDFPEATQIIFDVETIDLAISRLLEEDSGREMARAVLARLESQADDLLAIILEKVFSPDHELPIERTAALFASIDHFLQHALEEIIIPRIVKPDEEWTPTSRPDDHSREEE